MSTFRQWDVVKVRIDPKDKDEHPAVILSPDEIAGVEKHPKLNVLYGTTRRPAYVVGPHEVQLNGADGLERATLFSCGKIYMIDRSKISASLGRVGIERRSQLARRIVASFRLAL